MEEKEKEREKDKPFIHYSPTDLLNLEKKPEFISIVFRIKKALQDFITVMDFRSKVLEDFFSEISIFHLKQYYRIFLKFLFLYSYSLALVSPIVTPGNIRYLYLCVMLMICTMVSYFITFFTKKHTSYDYLTIIMVVVSFISILLKFKSILVPLEQGYTPAVQLIMIVYSITPLNFSTVLPLSLFFSIIYISFADVKFKFGPKNIDDIKANMYKPWRFFETFLIFSYKSDDKRRKNYILCQMFLWFLVNFAGIYLLTVNRMRRRASFLRLGENVKAQSEVKKFFREQMQCIAAIMPATIKDAYWKERKANSMEDMWVFTKCYDNVSILFADIVGFTKMSSNKTAQLVVTLLNDLFNRFDSMCTMARCEKLGTLGDCYYCVAGCPVPRTDHAACCVEMGLGMCRIIKSFNKDYNEEVNMRVGVHTGRVNAAIIGNIRFRFDVYSNDVIIANNMESSGEPGTVHISRATYLFIKKIYRFRKGEDLEIKKECKSGIAGMVLQTVKMPTYFVDPKSSHLLKKTKHIEKARDTSNILSKKKKKEGEFGRESSSSSDEDDECKRTGKMNADILFVESLVRDPDKQIKLFGNPPLWPMSLRFIDSEIEQHYHSHTTEETSPTYIDSVKLSPFFDTVACFIYTIGIYIVCDKFFHDEMNQKQGIIHSLLIIGLINVCCTLWVATRVASFDDHRILKLTYCCLSHVIFRNIQALIMICLPEIMVLVLINCEKFYSDYLYTTSYFSVAIFSVFCCVIFVSSISWINIICLCTFILSFMTIFITKNTCSDKYLFEVNSTQCYSCRSVVTEKQYFITYLVRVILDFIQTIYVLIILCRENEKNLRLCFYVAREATIRHDEAEKAMLDSLELLHNIIPSYVLDEIVERGGSITKGNCQYSCNIKSAAVIFACISNFFSSYYREDYKGGEGALKLLNKIICMFDALLKDSRYIHVEKIKTINDCYMVASGLNTDLVAKCKDAKRPYKALMNYCFDMQDTLALFNNEFVFGKDKFEMKIGYNIGPVTAGVIGTTKPLYDIWGDTVNVASRMYSTGEPGLIQVPERSKEILDNFFNFEYKGIVMVKGKGEMKTYIANKGEASKGRKTRKL